MESKNSASPPKAPSDQGRTKSPGQSGFTRWLGSSSSSQYPAWMASSGRYVAIAGVGAVAVFMWPVIRPGKLPKYGFMRCVGATVALLVSKMFLDAWRADEKRKAK